MAGSVNKVDAVEMYVEGASIPEVSEATGIPKSTLHLRLKKSGVLRSRADGVRNAAQKGRLGGGMRGKRRIITEAHRKAIQESHQAIARETAEGFSAKSGGYVEFTTGPNKGRGVHVVIMEVRLGRKLLSDECVHHIDEDKHNNQPSNLALVTRAGHQRLHKFQENLKRKSS